MPSGTLVFGGTVDLAQPCVYACASRTLATVVLAHDRSLFLLPEEELVPVDRLRGFGVVSVATGEGFRVAVTSEGRAWAWGASNDAGQLGLGSCVPRPASPALIPGPLRFAHVACGPSHVVAITLCGSALAAWGCNRSGQLGVGDRDNRVEPTLVRLQSGPASALAGARFDAAIVVCGAEFTLVVSGGGTSAVAMGDTARWAGGAGPADLPTPVTWVSASLRAQLRRDRIVDAAACSLGPVLLTASGAVLLSWSGAQVAAGAGALYPLPPLPDSVGVALGPAALADMAVRSGDPKRVKALALTDPRVFFRCPRLLHTAATLPGATGALVEAILTLRRGGRTRTRPVVDEHGRTALHAACEAGTPGAIAALAAAFPEAAGMLDERGLAPAHIVCSQRASGQAEALAALFSAAAAGRAGPGPAVRDAKGNTPAHTAAAACNVALVCALVRNHAADVSLTNAAGKTPLELLAADDAAKVAAEARKFDVFLSYAHSDAPLAAGLKASLEARGVRCWFDAQQLVAGADWRTEIGRGLAASKAVVFLATPKSVASPWCRKELLLGRSLGLLVCPAATPLGALAAAADSSLGPLLAKRAVVALPSETEWPSAGDDQAPAQLARVVAATVRRFEHEGPSTASVVLPAITPAEARAGRRFVFVPADAADAGLAERTAALEIVTQLGFAGLPCTRDPDLQAHSWGEVRIVRDTQEATLAEAAMASRPKPPRGQPHGGKARRRTVAVVVVGARDPGRAAGLEAACELGFDTVAAVVAEHPEHGVRALVFALARYEQLDQALQETLDLKAKIKARNLALLHGRAHR